MREETEYRPKPMVEVGGRPVLWHIMKLLSRHDITQFVICSGYKSEQIKEYFLDYRARNQDFTVVLGGGEPVEYHDGHGEDDWRVTVADTGLNTMTGGRVKRVQKYVGDETFICTYGDGIADIDVSALLAYHRAHGKLATVTSVHPVSRFGVLEIDDDGLVRRFKEKPQTEGWINIGYFVFEPGVFDYIDEGDDTVLEQEPLRRLAEAGQLAAYRHEGFWQPMDTYREALLLNELWDSGEAPWRTW
jgi:glucose-1-phosphate cytidylyltransferase